MFWLNKVTSYETSKYILTCSIIRCTYSHMFCFSKWVYLAIFCWIVYILPAPTSLPHLFIQICTKVTQDFRTHRANQTVQTQTRLIPKKMLLHFYARDCSNTMRDQCTSSLKRSCNPSNLLQ